MNTPSETLESLCFSYTKRITAAALSPDAGTIPYIESEINEAVNHLVHIQVGAPNGNLKVLALQLKFAKDSMVQDLRAKDIMTHAECLLAQRIQSLEANGGN